MKKKKIPNNLVVNEEVLTVQESSFGSVSFSPFIIFSLRFS